VTVCILAVSYQRSEDTVVYVFRAENLIAMKRKGTDSHWLYYT